MTHRHHIIPKHEWKNRFPNSQFDSESFNAPDNVVYLSVEQHSQVHGFLFELNNNPYDKVAQLTLSGIISKQEACRQASIIANKGKKHTNETKMKMSSYHRGRPKTLASRKALSIRKMGVPLSKAHREATSRGRMGLRPSKETRQKMSEAQRGKVMKKDRCIHCDKIGAIHLIKRWHNNNCRYHSIKKDVLNLRKTGMHYKDISKKLKVSSATLWRMNITT